MMTYRNHLAIKTPARNWFVTDFGPQEGFPSLKEAMDAIDRLYPAR